MNSQTASRWSTRVNGSDDRLSVALEEYIAAIEAGEPNSREDIVLKYNDIAEELMGCLDSLEFIHHVAPQLADQSLDAIGDSGSSPSASLGDFRILRELGRGGMGVVYEAEQISLGRHVALKVLPFAAMLDKQQLARFKNEARAAATLDHPSIVAIHSVGCERGVHYYAMQLIEGRSLAEIIAAMRRESGVEQQRSRAGVGDRSNFTESAEQNGTVLLPPSAIRNPQSEINTLPSVAHPALLAPHSSLPAPSSREYFRAVARLGIQAAEALDHAHQNGILHRDIKPANLLLDDGGKLWITDFGLARIEQDAGMTMTGDLLGTLRYMSPEQALAKRVVIDHRSDIYSLGVTLYELLTLRAAFSAEDRQELLRQIAFEEPPPLRKSGCHIAAEMATIIEKAIRKNPDERYATARELAEDLRSFLDNKPIKAKPPTRREQLVKWSRRHPAALLSATCVMVAVTIAAAVSAFLIHRAYQNELTARRTAELNQKQAEAIADFLARAFESPNPARDGRSVTVAEILTRAAHNLQTELQDQPLTRAALLAAIGRSRISYGIGEGLDDEEARAAFTESHRIYAAELGEHDPKTLESMRLLASTYKYIDPGEQVRLLETLLKVQREKLGVEDPRTISTMDDLSRAYAFYDRKGEALKLFREVVSARQKTLGPNNPDSVFSRALLAVAESYPDYPIWAQYGNVGAFLDFAHGGLGQNEALLPLLEKAVTSTQEKYGSTHPNTLIAKKTLAFIYCRDERYADAIRIYRECLTAGTTEKYGADSPRRSEIMWLLQATMRAQILAYRRAGRAADAERAIAENIATSLADGQYTTAAKTIGLATNEQVESIMASALAADYQHLQMSLDTHLVSELRLLSGKSEAAMPVIEAALARDPESYGYNNLGLALLAQGKSEEAKAAFQRAWKMPGRGYEVSSLGLRSADLENSGVHREVSADQVASAYNLDLISQEDFVRRFKDDKTMDTFPWFCIARRKEAEGDRAAAITAYKKIVELSTGEGYWFGIARWRLSKLIPTNKQ